LHSNFIEGVHRRRNKSRFHLATGLSDRSALVMQELALTRAELFRISRTDQLTGLLNRRGFDEAAIAALAQAHQEHLPVVAAG
jgi:PleD family two-component response regulator